MFGIVRRKSNSQLVRQELGQGVEHFKQAATHAARGTGATVGPKFYAARDRVQPAAGRMKDAASTGWGSAVGTLAPLAAAASSSSRKAGKDTRKAAEKNQKKIQKSTAKAMAKNKAKGGGKKSKLTGLLMAGAAVGAAGAYLLRRRNSQQWDEYDPSRPIGATETGAHAAENVGFEPATPTGTSAYPTPQPYTGTGSSTDPGVSTAAATDPTLTSIGKEDKDQTSSALHSPTVAKMASGNNPS